MNNKINKACYSHFIIINKRINNKQNNSCNIHNSCNYYYICVTTDDNSPCIILCISVYRYDDTNYL